MTSKSNLRLRAALERLGSSETMTTAFAVDDSPTGKELQARIQFARDVLRIESGLPDDEAPNIEPGRGKLIYDKARRTIVAVKE